MALSLVAFLACCLVGHVQASSRGFQPFIGEPAMRSLRANATLEKRWIGIEHGDGDGMTELWPNGMVEYAFADEDTEDKFGVDIMMAALTWLGAGLTEEFIWEKIERSRCANQRRSCLLISTSTDGNYYSDTGRKPIDSSKGYVGPRMMIPDKRDDERHFGSILHEMGHTWGLKHEHQNPAYWSKKYHRNENFDGKIFSEANFDCKALPDYEGTVEFIKQHKEAEPNDIEEICTRQTVAEYYDFSAAAFLPLEHQYVIPSENEIDWDSIMIYPTDMSGLKILKKPDGSDIPFNSMPTPRDVEGITEMYSLKYGKYDMSLLNAPGSPLNDKFEKLACDD